VILFLFYAAFVWYLCFKHRRQWRGLLALGVGMALLWLAADLYRLAIRWAKSTNSTLLDTGHDGKLFLMLLALEAIAVVVVGIFFWCLPREVRIRPCRRCKYELHGLDDDNPTCPECGLVSAAVKIRARRCPSCGIRTAWRIDREECTSCSALSPATPGASPPPAAAASADR
jgi:hypothetical protein